MEDHLAVGKEPLCKGLPVTLPDRARARYSTDLCRMVEDGLQDLWRGRRWGAGDARGSIAGSSWRSSDGVGSGFGRWV